MKLKIASFVCIILLFEITTDNDNLFAVYLSGSFTIWLKNLESKYSFLTSFQLVSKLKVYLFNDENTLTMKL